MARAIGEARDRVVAAEAEVGLAGIAERPAAAAAGQFKERAPPRTLDRYLDFGGEGHDRPSGFRDRAEDPREAALPPRRGCRPRRRWHPRRQAQRPPTGPPAGRKPQPMDLADDGVTRDTDLRGDLATGQSRGDAFVELLNALRRPGCSWWCSE